MLSKKEKEARKKVYERTDIFIGAAELSDSHFYLCHAWRTTVYHFLKKRKNRVCTQCHIGPRHPKELRVTHIKSRFLYPELSLDVKNLQCVCNNCMSRNKRESELVVVPVAKVILRKHI